MINLCESCKAKVAAYRPKLTGHEPRTSVYEAPIFAGFPVADLCDKCRAAVKAEKPEARNVL